MKAGVSGNSGSGTNKYKQDKDKIKEVNREYQMKDINKKSSGSGSGSLYNRMKAGIISGALNNSKRMNLSGNLSSTNLSNMNSNGNTSYQYQNSGKLGNSGQSSKDKINIKKVGDILEKNQKNENEQQTQPFKDNCNKEIDENDIMISVETPNQKDNKEDIHQSLPSENSESLQLGTTNTENKPHQLETQKFEDKVKNLLTSGGAGFGVNINKLIPTISKDKEREYKYSSINASNQIQGMLAMPKPRIVKKVQSDEYKREEPKKYVRTRVVTAGNSQLDNSSRQSRVERSKISSRNKLYNNSRKVVSFQR